MEHIFLVLEAIHYLGAEEGELHGDPSQQDADASGEASVGVLWQHPPQHLLGRWEHLEGVVLALGALQKHFLEDLLWVQAAGQDGGHQGAA